MLNTTFKLKYNISFSLEEINTHKVPFFKPYTLEETITSHQDDQDNQVCIIPEQFSTIARIANSAGRCTCRTHG